MGEGAAALTTPTFESATASTPRLVMHVSISTVCDADDVARLLQLTVCRILSSLLRQRHSNALSPLFVSK